jgi:hypothetical protein
MVLNYSGEIRSYEIDWRGNLVRHDGRFSSHHVTLKIPLIEPTDVTALASGPELQSKPKERQDSEPQQELASRPALQRIAEPTYFNDLDFEQMFGFSDHDASMSWEICDLFANGNQDSIDEGVIFHDEDKF